MFSVWIITHNQNCLDNWVYLVGIPVYLIVYAILKSRQKDVLRLLWDFVFINTVVHGKEIRDPMVFMLVVIPMINAINYTGRNAHIKLLSILTVGTLLLNNHSLEPWIIIPIISLGMMYFFAIRRYEEWEIDKSLTKSVDSYFTDPSMLKPHQIFAHMINDLNSYFHFKEDAGIKQIRTYTLKGNMLWLVNASDFLWERTLDLGDGNISTLKEKKELKIVGENIETYYFYIPVEGIEYIFTCVIYKTAEIRLKFYRFKDIMRMTFTKMSTLLCTEYRISERREKNFNEIKDNVLYVNQAVKTMHFIRNKLNPLSNLIAYHEEEEKMSEDVLENIQKSFKREVRQASKDLSDILNFANYLLDKSKNPFHGTEVKEISLLKIYIVLSEIAERYMNSPIVVDDSVKLHVGGDFYISTNLVECKIMFTDWINNMSKYSEGDEKISLKIDNDSLIIHFENRCMMNEESINLLIRDMNSKGKDAVLEGKDYGYGIYIIKSIANEFGVNIHASRTSQNKYNYLNLDFKFALYGRKEDSHL